MDDKEYALSFDDLYLPAAEKEASRSFRARLHSDKSFILRQGIVDMLAESFGFNNCLLIIKQHNVFTVAELLQLSSSEILSTKGIGNKKINLLKASLADFGLRPAAQDQNQKPLPLRSVKAGFPTPN